MTLAQHERILASAAAAAATLDTASRTTFTRRTPPDSIDLVACGPRGCPPSQVMNAAVASEAERLMSALEHVAIPRGSLGPVLPPAEAQRDALQRSLATG